MDSKATRRIAIRNMPAYLWAQVKASAAYRGTTAEEVVITALKQLLAKEGK